MSKETGGAAFPRPTAFGAHGQSVVGQEGMTLRDYFAAKAMQGCLAYSHVSPQWGNFHENCTPNKVAAYAYLMADAMLEARK